MGDQWKTYLLINNTINFSLPIIEIIKEYVGDAENTYKCQICKN